LSMIFFGKPLHTFPDLARAAPGTITFARTGDDCPLSVVSPR
jgi:hypothetical protein